MDDRRPSGGYYMMDQRRPSGDVMASMAEEFMTDWTSNTFRDRCLAQIETAKEMAWPQGYSDDPVESFLTGKSSKELEEFIFASAGTRENYLSLIAEILMMFRKHKRQHPVDTELLESASPRELVNAGMFDGVDNFSIPEETVEEIQTTDLDDTTVEIATCLSLPSCSTTTITTTNLVDASEMATCLSLPTCSTTTVTTTSITTSEISNGVADMNIETKKEVKSPQKSPTKRTPKGSPRKEVSNGIHEKKENKAWK